MQLLDSCFMREEDKNKRRWSSSCHRPHRRRRWRRKLLSRDHSLLITTITSVDFLTTSFSPFCPFCLSRTQLELASSLQDGDSCGHSVVLLWTLMPQELYHSEIYHSRNCTSRLPVEKPKSVNEALKRLHPSATFPDRNWASMLDVEKRKFVNSVNQALKQ